MITLEQYWMGRDKKYIYDLTDEIRENAKITVARANKLLKAFGHDRIITSGWRPPSVNKRTKGASKTSKHLTGRAIDLDDRDGSLDAFCTANQALLEELGLWLESPSKTPRWCHVQIVEPPSKLRVF